MNEAIISSLLEMAESQLRSGNLSGAEQACAELLAADPDNLEVLFLQGNMAHQKGNHEEAVDFFTRAVAQAPKIPILRLNLGTSLTLLKRYDESISQLKEATYLDPVLQRGLVSTGSCT